MARFHCVGVCQKSGEFQGQKYDNLILFCTFEADGMIGGDACKQFKIKVRNIPDVFEGFKSPKPIKVPADASQLVGLDLKVYCDTYGNPEEIFLASK